MSADIGPLKGLLAAADAIRGHLEQWLELYLNRVAGDYGIADVQPVRSWRTPLSGTSWMDDQMPAVSVVPSGVTEVKRRSDGFEVRCLIDVEVFVRGQDFDDTTDRVAVFVEAVFAALEQHAQVGDLDACRVTSYSIREVDPQSTRTIGNGNVTVEVAYFNALTERHIETPPDPVTDPVPADPTVQVPRLTITYEE